MSMACTGQHNNSLMASFHLKIAFHRFVVRWYVNMGGKSVWTLCTMDILTYPNR